VSDSGSNKKVANSLVALSSAAVLAVYAAGYQRTRAAADRFAEQTEGRRPIMPALPVVAAPALVPGSKAPPAPSPGPIKKVRPSAARVPAKKAALPEVVAPPAIATPSVATPPPASPVVVESPPPALAPPEPPAVPPAPRYRNGTYLGWGTSRHGDIQAAVVIEDGRILSATIAQCLTRYSCSVIANLPPQVAQRQSPETDYVSGATQSTNAFYYAVVDALSKAK
jgi:uncharacterized protein with FMN-binding domain